ncbi:MAG TPA: alpha/beta hydrolase [Solirubrobacteraceae bacterium]|jgi:pimeloyl-ACP methyl ester carboxylesterase|nr:alpha/beta hydrolase [Solirubrobacteraceae bacterium]
MVGEPPELPGVTHEHLDAGGLRMHVALAGAQDAPPLLLVHGWPQNWWSWRHVIPTLAERYRVIAPDLRGFGWSEAPSDGYDKQQLAIDLLALLDALELERVTWIGHDWGAWSGFLAALRAPERIEQMLALCIPHPWVKPNLRLLGVMLSYQGPISAPFLGERVADAMVRRILQFGRFGEPLEAADVDIFAEHIPPAVTVAMYRTFLTRELPALARGAYAHAKLQVPTTLILGRSDAVSRGVAAGAVDGQPNLRVELLERVAHWVPEQRPQAVIDWAQAAVPAASR